MTDSSPSPPRGAQGDNPHGTSRSAEARALGRMRLQTRRVAIRRIRRRVALGAVCLFLVCWLTIFGVLISGHDPALSHKVIRSRKGVSSSSTAFSSQEAASVKTTTDESGSSGSSGSESTASPLTTRQS